MPAATDAAVVLRLEGIVKRFGEVAANDGVGFELRRGEVLALLGENGAGKTTLMNVLFGHYVADAGRIEVFGAPLPPVAKKRPPEHEWELTDLTRREEHDLPPAERGVNQEHADHARDEELVAETVDNGAGRRCLAEASGVPAVEHVGDAGQHQDAERPERALHRGGEGHGQRQPHQAEQARHEQEISDAITGHGALIRGPGRGGATRRRRH